MSTTVTPDETTSSSTSPAAGPVDGAGALPVLAVDLVTAPSLLEGLAPLTRGLEEAGIGALTLSDGGLHPIHVAAHLAPLTRGIGLLPRTDAIYVEPFHLATQLVSLDHISHGRAGWLLQAETDPSAAEAVGREVLGLEATAREAADVLEAVRTVWGTWAPDAVVRDTERGVYVDASRLQYADVEAETFSVRGPAITPRSPQGLLPVFVADTDRADAGERVSGELADGRVLDLDVSGGARAEELAAQIASALEQAGAGPSAVAQQVRLVRLVGLDLEADPLGTVRQLADELRSRGLIAPAPAGAPAPSAASDASGAAPASVPASGRTLRDLLGLPETPFRLDPARRADRARLTSEENA
ncbi:MULTISPECIES: LLM class flavin-dependent oxidoreductase [Brachybacterium]|uniref:LLM class flavin-dependent oxidoreductase n=1 Tax=Brachybacterium TaxID=43668 RepID=UPI0006B5901C|nr:MULTISPECIES: LLM class flavin-dependent oxidoreductase [Brachybacterium]GAP77940.1 FMNH2-utilizing oxygenase [Brachybacterium sp. SW0106-09]